MRARIAAGRFLDLGCGDGGFLRELAEYDGTGFEIREGATQRHGAILSGDFPAWCEGRIAEAAPSFDFLTAWDVLEHLPALDRYVTAIRGILRDEGLFFCTIPDGSSRAARFSGRRWNLVLLEHLWYFTPNTFRRYVARRGFELLESAAFHFSVDVGTLASTVASATGHGCASRGRPRTSITRPELEAPPRFFR